MPDSYATLTKKNLNPDAKEAVRLWGMRAMQKSVDRIPHHAMKRKSVSAQMLAYWGFVPESIESVYDHVDEIVVAYGRCPEAAHIDDGSLDRIRAYPDPDKKIFIEARAVWENKKVMRQWCADHSSGNYSLVLDGDEVWVGLKDLFDSGVNFGSPRWLNFWHDEEHWIHDDPVNRSATSAAGQRWGFAVEPYGSYCPHYRWSWWRRSYYWHHHSMPASMSGELLFTKNSTEPPKDYTSESEMCAQMVPKCCIYHLGHALPMEVMEAKHQFYLNRDGKDDGRRQRMASWHNWKDKVGECGDGIVERVTWKLPGIVQRAFESMRKVKVKK